VSRPLDFSVGAFFLSQFRDMMLEFRAFFAYKFSLFYIPTLLKKLAESLFSPPGFGFPSLGLGSLRHFILLFLGLIDSRFESAPGSG